jgi:hypothetical protein
MSDSTSINASAADSHSRSQKSKSESNLNEENVKKQKSDDSKESNSSSAASSSWSSARILSSMPRLIPQFDDYAWTPAGGRITVFIPENEINEKNSNSKHNKSASISSSSAVPSVLGDLISDYSQNTSDWVIIIEMLGFEDSDGSGEAQYLCSLGVQAFGPGVNPDYAKDFTHCNNSEYSVPPNPFIKLIPAANWSENDPVYEMSWQIKPNINSVKLRDLGPIQFSRTVSWFTERGIQPQYAEEAKEDEDNDNDDEEEEEDEEDEGDRDGSDFPTKSDLTRALCHDPQYKRLMLHTDSELLNKFTNNGLQAMNPIKLLQLDDWYAGDPKSYLDVDEIESSECDRIPAFNPTYKLLAECVAQGSSQPYNSALAAGSLPPANTELKNWPSAGFHK